jgi:uncharacterized delta-60 repeat protein
MKTIIQSIKVFASLLSIILLLSHSQVSAQEIELQSKPGDLDFSFGIGGKVTDSFMTVIDLVIQKDNKIVVGGFAGSSNLARFHAKGVPDINFGIGGKAPRLLNSIQSVALQPDGKILAVGTVKSGTNVNFGLARYTADGMPDATFGNGGVVGTDFFGFQDEAFAIGLQADGRIVVGGYAKTTLTTGDSALACFNASGTPDFTFGIGGKLNLHLFFLPGFSEPFESIRDLVIQPDGRIVTVGASENACTFARFQANGIPDNSFGVGGKMQPQLPGASTASAVVLQLDGRLLISGSVVITNGGSDLMMMRLLADGTPDSSFGNGGLAYTDFNGKTDTGTQLVLLQDGRILQVGQANTGNVNDFVYRDFALVCFKPDGTRDNTFGNDGKVITDFLNDYDHAYAIGVQTNGRIIVGGQSLGGQNTLGLAGFVLTPANNQDLPQIQNVTVKGKKLIITGINFETPPEIYLDGEKQKKIASDELNPTTTVIALKAGRFILPGATVSVQVKNPATGKTSEEFPYTRPLQ